jgi:hypothetical protein
MAKLPKYLKDFISLQYKIRTNLDDLTVFESVVNNKYYYISAVWGKPILYETTYYDMLNLETRKEYVLGFVPFYKNAGKIYRYVFLGDLTNEKVIKAAAYEYFTKTTTYFPFIKVPEYNEFYLWFIDLINSLESERKVVTATNVVTPYPGIDFSKMYIFCSLGHIHLYKPLTIAEYETEPIAKLLENKQVKYFLIWSAASMASAYMRDFFIPRIAFVSHAFSNIMKTILENLFGIGSFYGLSATIPHIVDNIYSNRIAGTTFSGQIIVNEIDRRVQLASGINFQYMTKEAVNLLKNATYDFGRGIVQAITTLEEPPEVSDWRQLGEFLIKRALKL